MYRNRTLIRSSNRLRSPKFSILGSGYPLARSPCPNKMKTDHIDNSLLRHMSESQGFRIGEIIRYVTGNVPSSATAMYYLINRKLRKHYGNLRASGKIAAEHRNQQKTHYVIETVWKTNCFIYISLTSINQCTLSIHALVCYICALPLRPTVAFPLSL